MVLSAFSLLLRFLVLLLLVRLVLRFLAGVVRGLRPDPSATRRGSGAIDLVRCASCGTHVPRAAAGSVPGQPAFCSAACRERARAGGPLLPSAPAHLE